MLFVRKPSALQWTAHSRAKMRHYGLSEQRVRRVIHSPRRIEEGIAPKTVAMMQPSSVKTTEGKPVWTQEIWVMVQKQKSKEGSTKGKEVTKIISAWRYPGRTKPGQSLPTEILRELRMVL